MCCMLKFIESSLCYSMTGDSETSAEAPCINPGKIFALLSTKTDRRLQGHVNSLSAQE